MKKVFYLNFLMLAAMLSVSANASDNKSQLQVTADEKLIEKNGDKININATISVPKRYVSCSELMIITPVLRAFDGGSSIEFPSFAVVGRSRNKAIERNTELGYFEWDTEPEKMFKQKGEEIVIPLEYEVQYEPWMRNSVFLIKEDIEGCLRTDYVQNEHRLVSPALPPVYNPQYQLTYSAPPAGEVKERNELYVARINFWVDKYEILPTYMSNEAVFKEVDDVISDIKTQPGVTITNFKVIGYASPEGYVSKNMKLSENRAKAFVGYVVNKHGIAREMMTIDWKGEDWDGLVEQMKVSDFNYKDKVVSIVEGSNDPDMRKRRLMSLGASYKTLLREYYPYLRRSEYAISYTIRPFNLEEAKTFISTKPKLLSENEIYMVARSYPSGSSEERQALEIARKMFPASTYSAVNISVSEIHRGMYDMALRRLEAVNTPEAWNNIGYIYIKKGDAERASAYFKKAADAGCTIAVRNIEELNLWLQDPE